MNNLRKAREAAGLSQKQVAVDLSISNPTVSEWESGRKFPSTSNLIKLAQLYGVSIDYLVGINDDFSDTLYAKALQKYCSVCGIDFSAIQEYYAQHPEFISARIQCKPIKLIEQLDVENIIHVPIWFALFAALFSEADMAEYSDLYLDYSNYASEKKDKIKHFAETIFASSSDRLNDNKYPVYSHDEHQLIEQFRLLSNEDQQLIQNTIDRISTPNISPQSATPKQSKIS